MENETEYLQPIVGNLQSARFKYLTTCKAALFHLTLMFMLELGAVIFLFPLNHIITKCDLVKLLLFAQSGFWFISLILDHYYKWRHHFIKLDGHFDFYERITKYATRPLYVVSFWNVILLLFISILYSKNSVEKMCVEADILTPINILSVIISLQVLMLIPMNITYILCVRNFNKTRPVPDVEKRECWILDDALTAGEIGYSCNGEAVADLLQKQADLIYYYKCLNEVLNNKIMELSSEVRGKD